MTEMRPFHVAVASLFFLVSADARAYPAVQKRGAFGTFMTELATAAKRHDMRAMRRMTNRGFTVGEELDRRSSLHELDHSPGMRRALVSLVQNGGCYRTGPLVQCELPDTGPELDHMPLPRSTAAIFERVRGGWKMNALYASYAPP
jgi:hypothetical protein